MKKWKDLDWKVRGCLGIIIAAAVLLGLAWLSSLT